MKFRGPETTQEWYARVKDWHPHFCWWPRRVGFRDYRWLEWIERRWKSGYTDEYWDYRPKVDK
jgi:hypothetical protein